MAERVIKSRGLSDAGQLIQMAIDNHRRALAAWKASTTPDEDLPTEGDLWEAFAEAEFQFVSLRCFTATDIQLKLAYVERCRSIAESIRSDSNGNGTSYQSIFLRSLMLEELAVGGGE